MRAAYQRMHELGWAHSVECWRKGPAGGRTRRHGYRRVFFGESMFARGDLTPQAALAIRAVARRTRLRHDRLPDDHRPPVLARRTRGYRGRFTAACASGAMTANAAALGRANNAGLRLEPTQDGVATDAMNRIIPYALIQFYATAPYACSYLRAAPGALAGRHPWPPDRPAGL